MKRINLKYALPLLLLVVAGACKKNNLVVDNGTTIAPEAARFTVITPTTNNMYGYFILDNPAPGSKYDLPVGVTNVASTDRKVKLTYTSRTAVKGTHFTAPDELIIPAGSALATLSVQGIFNAYAGNRKDSVKIKLTKADGFIKPNAYQDSVTLVLQQYCPVVLANLSGNYTRTYENGSYGPYTTSLTNVTSTGASSATATLSNIYDNNITATISLDWAVPGAFKVTMTPQQTQYTSGGLPLFIRINPSNSGSTFDMCANTFTIYLQLYTTAGVYDAWTMTMAR